MRPTSLEAKIAKAKQVLAAKKTGKKLEDPKIFSEEHSEALQMAFAYETALGDYLHKKALTFFRKLYTKGLDKRTLTYMNKAVRIAKKHEVDYATYVKSQFYWFDRWFKRYPKVFEICSTKSKFPAEVRLVEYLKLKQVNQVPSEVSSPVLPSEKLSSEKIDKINQSRFNELLNAWGMSKEETFKTFALSGVFDPCWLKKQPLYQELNLG